MALCCDISVVLALKSSCDEDDEGMAFCCGISVILALKSSCDEGDRLLS